MKKVRLNVEDESEALRRIHVRPIEPQEKGEWDQIISAEHYLGNARLSGRTLRYVAELDGEWVALIGFGASAYHLKARDHWIGWDSDTRRRRLDLIVNNQRFLCRIDRRELPNVPSRVLRLVLDRLPDDWQSTYGFAPLLAETFVDMESFAGTCYKASNWIELGQSAGFGRSRADYYVAHDRPKRLFVRELVRDARELLQADELPKAYLAAVSKCPPSNPLATGESASLWTCFRTVEDPRAKNKVYKIGTLLGIAAAALMAGVSTLEGLERFSRRLTKAQRNRFRCPKDRAGKYRTPCANTFTYLFNRLDLEDFDRLLGHWIGGLAPERARELAVDGKVLRGSRGEDGKHIALLAVYAHRDGGVVGQVRIEGHDEIKAARQALQKQSLDGVLVSADALHTQTETARQIVTEKGGDYLFTVKINQPSLRERIEQSFKKNEPERVRLGGGDVGERPRPDRDAARPLS
jgi:hypothetical protein